MGADAVLRPLAVLMSNEYLFSCVYPVTLKRKVANDILEPEGGTVSYPFVTHMDLSSLPSVVKEMKRAVTTEVEAITAEVTTTTPPPGVEIEQPQLGSRSAV